MKILKPQVSIVILSICFLMGSTEILWAMKSLPRESVVHNADPLESAEHPVPKEAREATSAHEHKILADTRNTTTEVEKIKQPALDQYRPTIPLKFDTSDETPARTNLLQDDQVMTSSSLLKDETITATDEVKGIKNTSSINSIMKSVSDVPTAIYESLKKALDFVTRKIQQDRTLTPEERNQLKIQCETAKQNLQNLKMNPNPRKLQEVIDNFASIINEPIEGTTIHKDLMKAIDELDPDTKNAINAKIKELQTKDTEDLRKLRSYRQEARDARNKGMKHQRVLDNFDKNTKDINPSIKTTRLFENS